MSSAYIYVEGNRISTTFSYHCIISTCILSKRVIYSPRSSFFTHFAYQPTQLYTALCICRGWIMLMYNWYDSYIPGTAWIFSRLLPTYCIFLWSPIMLSLTLIHIYRLLQLPFVTCTSYWFL